MNAIPVQDIFFDDEATIAMGAAFDQASRSLTFLTIPSGVLVIADEVVE
jgi:hypothetical protein